MEPIVLVHGGAGNIPQSRWQGKIVGCKKATQDGYKVLLQRGSALDAVEAAVRSMELDDNFNAGYGSILTRDGTVEMEASIMDGRTMTAGCCSLVKDIQHPITLARRVMDKTVHNFLAGDAVMEFARAESFEILPPGALITEHAKWALEEWRKEQTASGPVRFARTEIGEVGTVGAVALDREGNLAVATSTGGITGKYSGRIGDTPVLGAGTYCDGNVGGVSTTGHGETIMKATLAFDILKRMEYLGHDAQKATKEACDAMTARFGPNGTGGAITIAKNGDVGVGFSSKLMAWCWRKTDELHFGIQQDQHEVEKVA